MTGQKRLEMMIDIETLSLRTNALVLSVGAVVFDSANGYLTHRTIFDRLQLEPQNKAGRHTDPQTVKWWQDQGQEARDAAFDPEGRVHPAQFLLDLETAFKRDGIQNIWAKGPQFDLVILQTLAEDSGVPVPWGYRQARDLRTIQMEARMPQDWAPEGKFNAHDPVDDCRFQIGILKEARKRLGIG